MQLLSIFFNCLKNKKNKIMLIKKVKNNILGMEYQTVNDNVMIFQTLKQFFSRKEF